MALDLVELLEKMGIGSENIPIHLKLIGGDLETETNHLKEADIVNLAEAVAIFYRTLHDEGLSKGAAEALSRDFLKILTGEDHESR